MAQIYPNPINPSQKAPAFSTHTQSSTFYSFISGYLAFLNLAPLDPAPLDPAKIDLTPIDPVLINSAFIYPALIDPALLDPAQIDLTPVYPALQNFVIIFPTFVDPVFTNPALRVSVFLKSIIQLSYLSGYGSFGTKTPFGILSITRWYHLYHCRFY